MKRTAARTIMTDLRSRSTSVELVKKTDAQLEAEPLVEKGSTGDKPEPMLQLNIQSEILSFKTHQQHMLTTMTKLPSVSAGAPQEPAGAVPQGPPVLLLQVLPKWFRVARMWFEGKPLRLRQRSVPWSILQAACS